MEELAIAWKVIRYCGRDCYHPLVYPVGFEVATSDDYGNHSPRVPATNGQTLSVTRTPSGRRLGPSAASPSPLEIQVVNEMPRGAVNVNLYKGGLLVARKPSVAPGMKAVFQFKPTLWIGVVSEVVEGQALSSAILSNVNTELSLLGIASADIVMTGGGSGADSTAYVFTLENVVPA
jgi:hypothetical protein